MAFEKVCQFLKIKNFKRHFYFSSKILIFKIANFDLLGVESD